MPYRGQCLLHRAQVLQVRGEWAAAVVEVERAQQRLSDPPHPAVGLAHYQLAELHRLRGNTRLAEGAYRQAHVRRLDQGGLASAWDIRPWSVRSAGLIMLRRKVIHP